MRAAVFLLMLSGEATMAQRAAGVRRVMGPTRPHLATPPTFAGAAATPLVKVVLSDDPNAKALDGSPYAYFVSQGSDTKKFVFYHQGGSWCQNITECYARSTSPLGSSLSLPSVIEMGDLLDRDPQRNPLASTWTMVYMPYLDGGSFIGDAEWSQTQPTLYFRGLKNREATIASLKQNFDFGAATDVLVGGGSAGGLAAYLTVDWYAAQAPGAKTRGIPDSGFFLDGDYNRDGKANPTSYEARMLNLYAFMNASSGLGAAPGTAACDAAVGYKCLFAYHLLPFLKTPVLALNSEYDATMGPGDCGNSSGIVLNWSNNASVNACGAYVVSLMKKTLQPPHAGFVDSCHHHCGEWDMIVIDSLNSSSALQTWYETGVLPENNFAFQNKAYPCAACCNTTSGVGGVAW